MDMESSYSVEPVYNVPGRGSPLCKFMSTGVTSDEDYEPPPRRLKQLTHSLEDAYKEAMLSIEHAYESHETFDSLAKLMTDITSDGKIKKRILREGYGAVIPKMATVIVDYSIFELHYDMPLGSTYLSATPFIHQLHSETPGFGFDIALRTMKMNEKSQFLIHGEYTYGKPDCLKYVQEDTYCLIEIVVRDVVNSEASNTIQKSPESQKTRFDEIDEYAYNSCMKADDLCKSGEWDSAIEEYNTSILKVESYFLDNSSDLEKRNQILMRLYTNLAVIYVKLKKHREGSVICNKAINICKDNFLEPPAMRLFNHARYFTQLGDSDQAEKLLKRAISLKPHDKNISRELEILDGLRRDYSVYGKKFDDAMFGATELDSKIDN